MAQKTSSVLSIFLAKTSKQQCAQERKKIINLYSFQFLSFEFLKSTATSSSSLSLSRFLNLLD